MSNYICFIIPPHMEDQKTRDVSDEVRRRRIGARIMKQSIFHKPHKLNLEDQDIFSAQGTLRTPGWKVADTHAEAEASKNKKIDTCWDNTQKVIEYYKKVLKFDIKDKLDGQVVSTIDYGEGYNNAFFNGEQMVYGDGDGEMFKDFCADITVICHELGHAVVDQTVPLVYAGMSGALNESFADVFAVCFAHYSAGKSFESLVDKDWLIGDLCAVGAGALRSFTDTPARPNNSPLGPDTDPRTMAGFYGGSEDDGGVHTNSGIINHAFYLVCKALGGNTWEVPLQLWFSVLAKKLINKNCNFQTFAKAIVTSAYSLDKEVGAKVRGAFEQVGLHVN